MKILECPMCHKQFKIYNSHVWRVNCSNPCRYRNPASLIRGPVSAETRQNLRERKLISLSSQNERHRLRRAPQGFIDKTLHEYVAELQQQAHIDRAQIDSLAFGIPAEAGPCS